jgi:alpha-mannosidase
MGGVSPAARHLIVVPHTHWDREWYRTHEAFRYRLVHLVDRLLEILEGDPGYRHFMLDGQTIVVDDYLAVRADARERIAKLVRDGRLLVGPWHVLPDEWLVSGEALVRNLRLGLRKAEALGGAMRLGYVPDQFGHVGQLPQLFAGFGFDAAVLWRGVGADVDRTLFRWEAPDGTRLLTVYLANGYGNAAQLPLETGALARRLSEIEAALAPRSPIPELLLMNGSDHLPPQAGLPAALEAAAARLPRTTVELGTLPGFVARAGASAPADLPLHRGELRSGLRAPLLPGCASARAPQKRAESANDRLLVRYLEPLAAWLGALGGDADPELIEHAWRIALENHPHDSVCGCSVDRVHDEMDTRFRRVEEVATAHLARVAGELAARVAAPAADFGRGAGEPLLAWNPNAAGPALADAELELAVPLHAGRPGAFHLRGADGRRIPVSAEVVSPEREFFALRLPKAFARVLLSGLGDEVAGHFVRDVRSEVREGALHLGLSISELPSGFDTRAALARLEAELARDDVRHLAVRILVLPRLRLRFADDLPGHGLRVYRVARGRAGAARLGAGRSAGGGAFVENEHWRVEADGGGRVRLVRRADGTAIEDALRLVSEGDRGDEYNFDPVPGEAVERPERVRVRLERAGEARAAVVIDARYRVPEGLAPERAGRSARRVVLPVRLRVALHADLDRVDVDVELDNTARDHRLRLLVRSPFAAPRFEVESAFEVAERPIAPGPGDFGSPTPSEFPIGAVPQRSFACLSDGARALTVANRGVAEVEALPEPDGTSALALSLLRAVGWLSRPDLRLRPGHAGPPFETPGAQVPGRHRIELALWLHAAGDPARIPRAHAFAAPPLVVPGGGAAGAPLRDGARAVEIDDPEVVVSALEPRADGRPVLRLFNASGRAREVRLVWRLPGGGPLEAVDLSERPAPDVLIESGGAGAVVLRLRPWQIASLRPT